jgi:hypothetical protein
LKQQKLVELIRANEIEEALKYARTHLRDGCKDEVEFLQQMESIMSLLAFSALPAEQNPMRHLLDQAARNQLGAQVNEKILEAQFAGKESQLSRIIKQLQHGQDALKQYMPNFPTLDTAPAAQSTSATAASAALPSLLDPARTFETLAASEAVTRRELDEQAARERTALAAALEAEGRAKRERDEARRGRRAEAATARANEPRSAFRHDIPSAAEEQDEDEDEEEDEQEDEEDEDRSMM